MNHTTKQNRTIGGVLVLIGAVLLIASLFVGWWSIQASTTGLSQSEFFGFPATNGGNGISYSCSGGSYCPSSQPYANASLSNTGNLYSLVQYLVVGGIVFGLLGAVLAFGARGRQGWTAPAIALVLLALILTIAAPILLTAAQPGAIKSDPQSGFAGAGNGTNPTNSFWGSTSSNEEVMLTVSWGASTGWYLAIVAFILFLVGEVVLGLARKPVPDDAAVMTGTASGTTPLSPEMGNPPPQPPYQI